MRPTKLPKKLKKTAFVPRGLFVGAIAATSVVPLCACGGSVTSGGTGGKDAASDTRAVGVARVGFDGAVFGVAQLAFDSSVGVAADAFTFDRAVGVAMIAFDAGPDADSGLIATVAACCFDGGAAPDAGDAGLVHGVPPVAFDGGK